MQLAFVQALDQAYNLRDDDAIWLERVTSSLATALDTGQGMHAFLADLRDPAAFRLHTPVSIGLEPRWESRWYEDWWQAFILAMPPKAVASMMQHSVCNYSHELWDALERAVQEFGPHLQRHRADPDGAQPRPAMAHPDSLNLVALDASGVGCAFVANRPEVVAGAIPRETARTLKMLATHIAAAYRLRQRLRGRDPLSGGETEAILDERHRVLHAEGEAKSRRSLAALRECAIVQAHVRRGPEDPTRTLEAWSALTSGRWSVLDHFDRDGRRYFIARVNTPKVTPHAALNERETQVVRAMGLGHSNKLIAYELGLHTSTISGYIASASRKLGVRTRRELVLHGRLLCRGPQVQD